jgi:beta-N-acetylhexosaminidase
MFMVGMPGSALDAATYGRVVNQGVGGVIFLEHNGISPQQLQGLTADLQRVAQQEGPGLPLFIGWNHEGGRVVRRGAGMTQFPSAMALGAIGQPELVYQVGQVVGQEMTSLGVNMNYAPVLDVNTAPANPVIGLRSFGEDPALVAALGQQYIIGQQSAGIIAVAKHFPGHGSVTVDSHIGLPRLDATDAAISQTELPPFQAALVANVGAVMVAHLQVPALEPDGWPASLSPSIVGGLLRQQMGYAGVIMTDDMNMGALNAYTPQEAAVQAVLAGNDVLVTVNQANYELFRQALLDAVANGRIPEARIDESVRRIITLKLAYNLGQAAMGEPLPERAAHQILSATLGRLAARLIRDNAGWLPLNLPTNRLLVITPNKLHVGSATGDGVSLLGELLQARGVTVTELVYIYNQPESVRQVAQQALALTSQVDGVVVVTWDAILRVAHVGDTVQEAMVNDLLATGKPVVAVAGQLPYDAYRLTAVPTLITLYGDTPGQIDGAVAWLLGP